MNHQKVATVSTGVNQHGLRDHNERLILSTILRHGAISGSEIAKLAGLSPQTVSVILRALEAEGLLKKGEPVRGKVGKPSVPMQLREDGAFSFGLKIGRRTADLVLTDFVGTVRGERKLTYTYPKRDDIIAFLKQSIADLTTAAGPSSLLRNCGIGIAMPFEIWNWHDSIGAPPGALDDWIDFDLAGAIAAFSNLSVLIENDATAACRAELLQGRGREFSDFGYFFIGSFIGGGVVLNGTIFEGQHRNAGSFGSLPMRGADGADRQLIDLASLFLLEDRLVSEGLRPDVLWQNLSDWSGLAPQVDAWIATTSVYLARAVLALSAVMDFEAVLIDGAFPDQIRAGLVAATQAHMPSLDRRGLSVPLITQGSVGPNARALGAARLPITSTHFLRAGPSAVLR